MSSTDSVVHINEGDLVRYIKEYYDNTIASQLQANYGRVFVKMSDSPQSIEDQIHNEGLQKGFDQVLFEKRSRELRDKTSFDSFSPTSSGPSVISHGTSLDSNLTTLPTQQPTDGQRTTSLFSRRSQELQPETSPIQPQTQPLSSPFSIQPLQALTSDAQMYKGKSLHLGRDVEFNDVIFAERPITSLSLQPEYIQCCDNCLRPLTSLEEQIWSLLMGGEKKTAKATGPNDIIALLEEIAPLKEVIDEYIYLSSVGDDDLDNFTQEGFSAVKNGKLTQADFIKLQKRIGEEFLTEQRKNAIVEFYTKTVLKQYNHVLKHLHLQERSGMTHADVKKVERDQDDGEKEGQFAEKQSFDLSEVQQAVFDVIASATGCDDITLDLNDLNDISVFEPSTRLGEVRVPVYSPYNDNMYCSLRCFCIAYNNYDHILTTAHPLKGKMITDVEKLMNPEIPVDTDIAAILEENFQSMVENGDYGDDVADSDVDSDIEFPPPSVQTYSIHSKRNKKAYPFRETKLPTPPKSTQLNTTPINTSTTTIFPTNPIAPGELTTAKDMIPGPSGLPFLQQSELYTNLVQYARLSNPMLLSHIRAITQSISHWGMKLVGSVGGDYSDIISLLAMQSEWSSVENPAFCINLVNYDQMLRVHNNYITKMNLDGNEIIEQLDDVESSVNAELDGVITKLTALFDSNIQSVLNGHAANIAALQKQSGIELTALHSSSRSTPPLETQMNNLTLYSGDANPTSTDNTSHLPHSLYTPKSITSQCYCTECLSDLSYTLLQYSLFPHLLFTQTQWFMHVHDSNGDDYFQHMAKQHKNGPSFATLPTSSFPADNNNSDAKDDKTDKDVKNGQHSTQLPSEENSSLFSHQISLLEDLQTYFEPILHNYMFVMTTFLSCVTRLYPICFKKAIGSSSQPVSTTPTTTASTTTPPLPSQHLIRSPYFVELLATTAQADPSCILSLPTSSQEVKELMNDIPQRVAEVSRVIQRPLDCANWLFLSLFVSTCEMNNIEISPKSGVVDLLEFLTISDILNLDPEDLPEAQEQLEQMHQAALNVWIRQNMQLADQSNATEGGEEGDGENKENRIVFADLEKATDLSKLPDHLYSKEKYMEYVLGVCGKLMGTKGKKKVVSKKATVVDSVSQVEPASALPKGDATKAWNLLVKRVDNYPECSGLFRVSCTMNHSCSPNCAVIGLGDGRSNLVAIVALRDIKAGEELTISYIDEEDGYKNRQSSLADYQFKCECPKCITDAKRIAAKKAQAAKAGLTTAASKTSAAQKSTLSTAPKPTTTTTTTTTTKTTVGTKTTTATKPGPKKTTK